MRIEAGCEKCLYDRQVERVRKYDAKKRDAYLWEVRRILKDRDKEDSAPYMVYLFNQAFKQYFEDDKDYSHVRKEYNDLVMHMEHDINEKISMSSDPLETSLLYARIGNYIDFGALKEVDREVFLSLFERMDREGLDKGVYESFCRKCGQAESFILLCDNCGEIVLDKLFIRQLKRRFPQLHISVMVRGEKVLNDAVMEDAVYCGMDQEAQVISNGNGVAGTVEGLLSPKAKEALNEADVILAKGQGNYETLAGHGRNVFYLFLCQCDLFVSRFGVPKLTGMFVEEKE